EVVAVPGHERHEHISSQGQFAVSGSGSVGNELTFLDALAHANNRLLVKAGSLVQANELPQTIFAVVNADLLAVNISNGAAFLGANHHAAVASNVLLQSGCDNGRLSDKERHGLPLHVRSHQRAVGVVMFEKRNESSRDADHLLG